MDLVFRFAETLKPLLNSFPPNDLVGEGRARGQLYQQEVAPQLAQEIGSRFGTASRAPRQHRLGGAQVKMYDKFHLVLRIETTANDVSFFSATAGWNIARAPAAANCAPQEDDLQPD